jgi:hypothetical protein
MEKIKNVKKPRKHTSIFFITISSNKTLPNDMLKTFNDSIPDVFDKNLISILKAPNEDVEFDPKMIDDYNVKIGYERGPQKKKDHAHVLITIHHHTMLTINHAPIRDYYEKMLGTKIHLHIDAMGSNIEKMQNYLFKNLDEEK